LTFCGAATAAITRQWGERALRCKEDTRAATSVWRWLASERQLKSTGTRSQPSASRCWLQRRGGLEPFEGCSSHISCTSAITTARLLCEDGAPAKPCSSSDDVADSPDQITMVAKFVLTCPRSRTACPRSSSRKHRSRGPRGPPSCMQPRPPLAWPARNH